MGRIYSAVNNFTTSSAFDLFSLTIPADTVVVLHEIVFGQAGMAGIGHDQMLRIRILRAIGDVSAVNDDTVTPAPIEQGSPASGVTVGVEGVSLIDGGGGVTVVDLYSDFFNVREGFHYRPSRKDRLIFTPESVCVIDLVTSPQSEIQTAYSMVFEEIGG